MAEPYQIIPEEKLKSMSCSTRISSDMELDLKDISSRYQGDNFICRLVIPHAGLNYDAFLSYRTQPLEIPISDDEHWFGILIPGMKSA